MSMVRRLRDMYRFHTPGSHGIRLSEPDRLPQGAPVALVHEHFVAALAAAVANPRLSELRRWLTDGSVSLFGRP